jgi:CheY-like chemotaxis protein
MSQVGLFSTQISEQILRLRALSQDVDARTEQRAVDLRRAIMATRLLAGSARILEQSSLRSFLDELLHWLQSLEGSPRQVTPTQELMLESVIELEEQLMVALDEQTHEREDHEQKGIDLDEFEEQLQDLVTLLRRDQRPSEPPGTRPPAEGRVPRAAAKKITETRKPKAQTRAPKGEEEPSGATPTDRVTESLGDLERLLASMETRLRGADPEARRATQDQLQAISERIRRLMSEEEPETPEQKGAPSVPPPPSATAEPEPASGLPKSPRAVHAVLRNVVEQLRELESEGWMVDARLSGRAPKLPAAVRELLAEILGHLCRDVVTMARAQAVESKQLRISVELRDDLGRLQVLLRDDAPRASAGALIDDPDQLALLSGLRRARILIQQSNGLIQVEPEDRPSLRYVVTLALDPRRPTYALLPLETQTVAVPWALIEEVVEAETLTFELDPSGESFRHRGREIALVDLAQFVPALLPARTRPGHVAVVGSVEKRLGIAVYQDLELLRPNELLDPPTGWESIAYAGLERHEQRLPVLDLKRLVQLRFVAPEEVAEAGSRADEYLDSYVPSSRPEAEHRDVSEMGAPSPAAPSREAETDRPVAGPSAVLINQSDFRRSELSRVLERAGFDVVQAADLAHAEEKLSEHPSVLLVSDLRLGQEGVGSFHTIRRAHPHTVLLLTSAVAADHAQELAERAGAHACWLEPFRRSELDALLRKWRPAVRS